MDEPIKLKAGVNLGGWLSQYKTYDLAHFDSFIQEDDLKQIASWGMDHVRLPIDYPILEDGARPGIYQEGGFSYIERCLSWCQKYGLNLVLDLHKAPGYVFDRWNEARLFSDPDLIKRYVDLWALLARRYRGVDALAFELLNEINLPDATPWNQLIKHTIDAIHGVDENRIIIIGGNHHNAADQLEHLDLYQDQRILYTFHCYNPMVVTHQKAYWVPTLEDLKEEITYPGLYPDIAHFGKEFVGRQMDRELLKFYLQPALDFMRKTGKALYCGEFGVIDRAPIATRVNWIKDFLSLLQEFEIGWAIWSYKAMDFGLVDLNGKIVNDEIIEIIRQGQGLNE